MQSFPVGIAIAHCGEAPAAGLRPLRIDRRGHAAQHLARVVLGETAVGERHRGARLAADAEHEQRQPGLAQGLDGGRHSVVDAVGLGVGHQQDGLGLPWRSFELRACQVERGRQVGALCLDQARVGLVEHAPEQFGVIGRRQQHARLAGIDDEPDAFTLQTRQPVEQFESRTGEAIRNDVGSAHRG
jgi:hypothetical protein